MKKLMTMLCLLSFSVFAKLPTVEHVDVSSYLGKWYAVYSMPQRFTKNCVAQTADYGLINESTVSVLNTCIKKDGSTKTIEGQAVVTNFQTNSELEVTFNNFWTKLFRVKGDYNILKLDEGYNTVLVGSNNLKSLWILSRTPYISEDVKNEYINYAKSLGFDVSTLIESKF